MPTTLAYLIVVLVWATTPLAIKWSAESVPPVMAGLFRMMLAVGLGLPWLWLQRRALPWHWPALRSYLVALPGVFGAMALSYLAAPHVPSGMISVMFGLAPLLSGLLMHFIPGNTRLNLWHWAGCLLGVAGLAVVFADAFGRGANTGLGLLLLLGAVSGFVASGLLVKRWSIGLPPLTHTLGAIIVSLPCYATLSWIMGERLELGDNLTGLVAIVYLALFGSLVGFACYFLILSRLSAASVALVTLITPVLALMLGALLNGEFLPARVLIGVGVIIAALGLYVMGDRRVRRSVVAAAMDERAVGQ